MSDLISVIIPVYNTEKYIEKCIESVLAQTYTNLEIICVDDGSNDSSPGILDKYAQKHSCIKVIHQENGGISIARNKGIGNSTGAYIAFLDSDDSYHPQMLEIMYRELKSSNVDLAVCQIENFTDANLPPKNSITDYQCLLHKNTELLDWYYGSDRMKKQEAVLVCLKLYKREIFEDIRFPENRVYEDNSIFHIVADKIDRFIEIPIPLYFRLLHSSSIMGRTKTIQSIQNFDILYAMKERCCYYSSNKQIGRLAYLEYLHTINVLYKRTRHSNLDKRTIYSKLKREYWKYLMKAKKQLLFTFADRFKSTLKYLLM